MLRLRRPFGERMRDVLKGAAPVGGEKEGK